MGSALDTPKLLEKQIDRLYGVPLEAFTQARDELARGLRASGDLDGAARVRRQEGPTVAAWAVNQLARRRPRELRALFAAVDRVSAAEDAAPGGESAAARQARDVERAARSALLDAARQILEHEERRRHGVLERVAAILREGTADPESRRLLKAGRLTRELEPARAAEPPVSPESPAHPARRRDDRAERLLAARERLLGLEAEVRDLKLAVRVAEGQVRDAEREAERTHREAEEARSDLRRAERELELAATRAEA